MGAEEKEQHTMWSVVPLSECPVCGYVLAEELRGQAHFCPQCRFPLRLIAGKYRLQRLLGEGGAGKVYLAHHAGLQEAQERVVKILDEREMTAIQIERFHREVQLTARVSLANEHIVRIYDDFGHEPNLGYYYVMEYLEGQDLRQILDAEGPLPLPQAMEWMRQLCEGITEAHRAGVMHRDLKPANLLLLERPQGPILKIIDFGIAKQTADAHNVTDHPVGTPLYMSPEQCLGQVLDPRSDQYAMALILYEMLTASDPFGLQHSSPGDDILTVVYAQIHEPPRDPCTQWPALSLPRKLGDVLLRALAKDPGERYPTVESFWQHLADATGLTPPTSSSSSHTLSLLHHESEFAEALADAGATTVHAALAFDEDEADNPAPTTPTQGWDANEAPTQLALPSWEMLQSGPALSLEAATVHTLAPTLPSFASWSELPVPPPTQGNLSGLHIPANRFFGRKDAWLSLESLWDEGARLVTLLGPSGIGKTRLAQEYGHHQRKGSRWPGGVWALDLSQARSLWDVLDTLARTLRVNLPETSTLQGAFDAMGQILHAHGPSLWILDPFEPLARFAHDILGPWMQRAPDAHLLVTSRQRLRLPQETVLELPPLSHTDAFALFVDRASEWTTLDTRNQEATLHEILDRLDGIPLALELAASRLHSIGLPELLLHLSQQLDVLRHPTSDPEHAVSLRETLHGSWHLLSSDQREVLAQCSVFSGGFSQAAAEAVVHLESWPESPSITHILAGLRDHSLVRLLHASSHNDEQRFALYRMIQSYAAEQLAAQSQQDAAERRHAQHFVQWGNALTESDPGAHNPDTLAALELERDNLRAIHQRFLVREPETALQAYLLLFPVLTQQGGTAQYLDTLRSILKGQAIFRSQVRVRALQVQAEGLRRLGRVDKARALLEDALTMAYTRHNQSAKAAILSRLGHLYRLQGSLESAEAMHREALVLCRQSDDLRGTSQALGQLGTLYRLQGRLDEAERLHREALQLDRHRGDPRGQGIALSQLAHLLRSRGRLDEAMDAYHDALALHRHHGDRRGESIALSNIGRLQRKQGHLQDADRCFQQVVEICRTLGDRHGESIALDQIGLLQQLRGHYPEASALHVQALSLSRQRHEPRGQGYSLQHLARICRLQGESEACYHNLQQALLLHQAIPDPNGVGRGLYQLALMEWERHNPAQAMRYLQQSLSTLRHHNLREAEGEVLLALSALHHLQDDLPAALQHNQEALHLAMELGDQPLQATSLCSLIAAAADHHKFEKAHGALTQARKLCDALHNPTLTLTLHVNAAHLDFALAHQAHFQQQYDVSQTYFQRAYETWNKAAPSLQHAFVTPLSEIPAQPNPTVAANDLLRLFLQRLQRSLFAAPAQATEASSLA